MGIAVPLGAHHWPQRSRKLLGGLLATPRFAAEQEPQRPGCPSRWEVPSVLGRTMEPPAEAPPAEAAATPTLLDKFRGRNTMLSVLGEHKAQEAKREARRQREIERRRKLARRIAIYLRVGVCDYRGDALSRDCLLYTSPSPRD